MRAAQRPSLAAGGRAVWTARAASTRRCARSPRFRPSATAIVRRGVGRRVVVSRHHLGQCRFCRGRTEAHWEHEQCCAVRTGNGPRHRGHAPRECAESGRGSGRGRVMPCAGSAACERRCVFGTSTNVYGCAAGIPPPTVRLSAETPTRAA